MKRHNKPEDFQTCSKQKDFDYIVCTQKYKSFLSNSPIANKRLEQCASKYSGSWLEALPSNNLGLRLTNQQLSIAAGLRLGCPIVKANVCECGSQNDSYGIHGLSCKMGPGKHFRHASCNKIISLALLKAKVPNSLEPNDFNSLGLRPDGLTHIPFKSGKLMTWDFTCIDSLAPSYINNEKDA